MIVTLYDKTNFFIDSLRIMGKNYNFTKLYCFFFTDSLMYLCNAVKYTKYTKKKITQFNAIIIGIKLFWVLLYYRLFRSV